jgi:hypothetical protein
MQIVTDWSWTPRGRANVSANRQGAPMAPGSRAVAGGRISTVAVSQNIRW